MPSLNTAARNHMADAIVSGFSTATLTILAGATALATHTLTGLTNSNGVVTAAAIADATIAGTGTSTATGATLTMADRTLTLSVGTSGTEVIVPTLSYTQGGTSSINSLTITYPAS